MKLNNILEQTHFAYNYCKNCWYLLHGLLFFVHLAYIHYKHAEKEWQQFFQSNINIRTPLPKYSNYQNMPIMMRHINITCNLI